MTREKTLNTKDIVGLGGGVFGVRSINESSRTTRIQPGPTAVLALQQQGVPQ